MIGDFFYFRWLEHAKGRAHTYNLWTEDVIKGKNGGVAATQTNVLSNQIIRLGSEMPSSSGDS
jgi:hypothetical protein